MAVQKISGVEHYIAQSTDDKPTDAPAGSTLWEVTTGSPPTARKYIFDGSTWVLIALDDATE